MNKKENSVHLGYQVITYLYAVLFVVYYFSVCRLFPLPIASIAALEVTG